MSYEVRLPLCVCMGYCCACKLCGRAWHDSVAGSVQHYHVAASCRIYYSLHHMHHDICYVDNNFWLHCTCEQAMSLEDKELLLDELMDIVSSIDFARGKL